MQHIHLTFLIALCVPHIIFSMDKTLETIITHQTKTRNTNDALDEMVDVIDKRINDTYSVHPLVDIFYPGAMLKEKDYFNIIATINECYKIINPSEYILDKLNEKNNFFASAINYFVTLVRKNFDAITPETLNIVDNHLSKQPIEQLNQLHPSIKKYVMHLAQNKSECTYTMQFSSEADVIAFDMCPATDLAAISSGNNKTPYRLRLWDLKTNAPAHTFEEEDHVSALCFNSTGTQLATVVISSKKTKIKIWNPLVKTLCHIIKPDQIPHNLTYTDSEENFTLCAIHWISTPEGAQECTNIWLINQETPFYLGSCSLGNARHTLAIVEKENYYAHNPRYAIFNTTTLYVAKNKCHHLDLCQKAIKMAQTIPALDMISASTPYASLTPHEKKLIAKELNIKKTNL
jgi:hypothetical protein